jgi:hypothetical protein
MSLIRLDVESAGVEIVSIRAAITMTRERLNCVEDILIKLGEQIERFLGALIAWWR